MGLYPSLASWLNTLPETMTEANKIMIESLFRWLIPPCIKLIRKELKEICPTSDIQLAWSFFKMFSSLLTAFKVEPKKFALTEKDVIVHIECIFLVSMTWSVCCSIDRAGREKFDGFLRECIAGTVPPPYSEEGERGNLTISNPFPKEGSIYSYYFDAAKGKWATWSNLISKDPLPDNLEPHEIIVPTIDTARLVLSPARPVGWRFGWTFYLVSCRYTFWVDTFCQNAALPHSLNRMGLLLCGPTGKASWPLEFKAGPDDNYALLTSFCIISKAPAKLCT